MPYRSFTPCCTCITSAPQAWTTRRSASRTGWPGPVPCVFSRPGRMAGVAPAPVTQASLAGEANRRAELLAVPALFPDCAPWLPQSLSAGTACIALLHIERAHARHSTWRRAHEWITHAVTGEVSASGTDALYQGL